MFRVSAKVDYAVRALAVLARRHPDPVKGDVLARLEGIPFRFLEGTLAELRNAGLVTSRRGTGGGYRLGRPADRITLADVMTALEGDVADIRAVPADEAGVELALAARRAWSATEQGVRQVLGSITIAALAGPVDGLVDSPAG